MIALILWAITIVLLGGLVIEALVAEGSVSHATQEVAPKTCACRRAGVP